MWLLGRAVASGQGGYQCDAEGNYWWSEQDVVTRGQNCEGLWRCYRAEPTGVYVEKLSPACNPNAGLCAVKVHAYFEAEGVNTMWEANNHHAGTPTPKIYWYSCGGANCTPSASCGAFGVGPGEKVLFDHVDTWFEGDLSCNSVLTTPLSVKVAVCEAAGTPGCRKNTTIELPPIELAQQLECSFPPPQDHDCECTTCRSVGGGSAGLDGGPASIEPEESGPGGRFRYQARGAGFAGMPGHDTWRAVLGLGWSHDYAQRVFFDPVGGGAEDVWLVTERATFRHFFDLAPGTGLRNYESSTPTSEKRKLFFDDGAGTWRLEDLDGKVTLFDAEGKWVSTTDRFGNETTGTYNGTDQLTSVTKPDGRSETFTYAAAGKLASITEVGVGVADCGLQPADCRTWNYAWVNDVLQEIARPDGTKWLLRYEDGRFPGYLTRMILLPSSGTSQRIEAAWQYDALGRVSALWRGGTTENLSSPPSPSASALDRWLFSYTAVDPQGRPTSVTMTDPLGAVSTASLGYDPASNQPRLLTISGDCPSCISGPNATFAYEDPANPTRPTRIVDARGTHTDFEYDENGKMTARIEAANNPDADPDLPRITEWSYHPTFPALVTEMQGPTTLTLPSTTHHRRAVSAYDPVSGVLLSSTSFGEEVTYSGGEFTLQTAYTAHNGAGQPLTIDPPGYGAGDQTTVTYDSSRGDLLVASRTEPFLGTTSFAYDAFNRRATVTDPNNLVTETVYDALNRVTQVTQFGPDPGSTNDDLVTKHLYTGLGDLGCTIHPMGNAVHYIYNTLGQVTKIQRAMANASPTATACLIAPTATVGLEEAEYQYDAVSHRTREVLSAYWPGEFSYTDTRWIWKNRCQLEKTIRAFGTPAQESTTEIDYDCNGNVDRIWDPLHLRTAPSNPTTTYTYDRLNRVASMSQPWGGTGGGNVSTAYDYDVEDHLVSVTDGEGSVTTYEHSDRDLMTSQASPVSGTTSYSFNDHGEQTTQTDARSLSVTRTIDAADRVTFVDYSDSTPDDTYTYGTNPLQHQLGRLISIDNAHSSVPYGYDHFGRLTTDGVLGYDYDKNGNRNTILYPGLTATYTFDYADRDRTLVIQEPGGPVQNVVREPTQGSTDRTTYYPFGPLAEFTYGTSIRRRYSFWHDARYFPMRIEVRSGTTGGPFQFQWQYTVDRAGNPTIQDDQLATNQDRRFAYQDFQYYLTCAAGPWNTVASGCTPISGQPLRWTYDRIGNRTAETRGATTDNYSYVLNGVSGNTAELDLVQLAGGTGGTRDYTFDAAGYLDSVTSGSYGVNFSFDAGGRGEEVGTLAGGDLDYDGRGLLASAMASTGKPIYSSTGIFYGLEGSEALSYTRYVLYFAGRPVLLWTADLNVIPATPVLTFLATDHLGTPVYAMTPAAAQHWLGGFEPFGRDYLEGTINDSWHKGIILRLPGQWDTEALREATLGANVFYNAHRWYEQQTGRYTQLDPLGIRLAPKLGRSARLILGAAPPTAGKVVGLFSSPERLYYGYAASSPLNWIDPLGLRQCPAQLPASCLFNSDQQCCVAQCISQTREGACSLADLLDTYDAVKVASATTKSLIKSGSAICATFAGAGETAREVGLDILDVSSTVMLKRWHDVCMANCQEQCELTGCNSDAIFWFAFREGVEWDG